jgi:hypothetical protein
LFHDTAVTDRGFGVHKFWAELERQYPSFNFLHSWGLGVLGVGRSLPPALVEFLETAKSDPERMREFFAALGGRISFASKYKVLMQVFFEQQGLVNDWKRKIGGTVDPKSEQHDAAMAGAIDFAIASARQMYDIIQDDLALREKLRLLLEDEPK